MGPRPPILKSGADMVPASPLPFARCHHDTLPSQHVHFPPTPTMSSFQTTYSPTAYDRAPIVVGRNSCAIPERGSRRYTQFPSPATSPVRSYFHPRSFEACEGTLDCSNDDDNDLDDVLIPIPSECPALIPDLMSSESDESDATYILSSPTCAIATYDSAGSDVIHPMPFPGTSPEDLDHALSFLPHPPSGLPKDSPKLRKIPKTPRRRINISSDSESSSFSGSDAWAGCLGGF